MNILICWAINHVWILENGASSEEITHLVKVPRYVRFFNFDRMELVAEVSCS
jgi:hypothetical protein